jgi:SAM-dependent methyltransferase
MSGTPVCRTCGCRDVITVGRLPDVREFAGTVLRAPLPGGELWRCRECNFIFRDPLLEPAQYEQLYRDGSAALWESDDTRPDFALVRQHVAGVQRGGSVLDVGCYTGQLLASLGSEYRVYGVEPNTAAAGIAATRGVTVLAGSIAGLARAGQKFDVITACDVIEHVPNPLDFLLELRRHLNPGGRLLLSTGNSDAWLWRLAGAHYWYCYFAEHISFIGRRWLEAMPNRADSN